MWRSPASPLLIAAFLASACTEPKPATGGLVVTVSGLPSGANASVRVSGPVGTGAVPAFNRFVTTTTTFDALEPGTYAVRTDTVQFSQTRYGVDSAGVVDSVSVERGGSRSHSAQYTVASGSIDLSITGLPVGIPADIRITGPGYQSTITVPGIVGGLTPGQYIIASDTMTSIQGDHFGASTIRDTVMVTASVTPVASSVAYTLVSGTLAVNVTGLPATFDPVAPVTVTGPNGYLRQFGPSTTLRGLRAGSYILTATTAHGTCPFIYTTPSAPATFTVVTGEVTNAGVTYTETQPQPQDLNLRVDAVHLIQTTQDYAGTVPIIAGKPALLRVFGLANQCNGATPAIRITISGGAPINVVAPEAAVRRLPAEGVLQATWNVNLPASAVQLGLTVVAEIDPTNAVAEANESDNTATRNIDVRVGPTVGLMLIPLSQTVNGETRTGDITPATLNAFMDLSRRIHPVLAYDVNIHPGYTTTAGALGASGNNWTLVLQEIAALQAAEQSNRYYYGVAKVSYNEGVAGIAYVNPPAGQQLRVGLGWDYLPTGSSVLAHELGHNFGRFHTPCGGPLNVDPNYPATGFYSGGRIGTYGYDAVAGTMIAADVYTDIMGYCTTHYWISDYTYVRIFNRLMDPGQQPSLPVIGSTTEQPALLVWGSIVNGVPVLEPAFEISGRAVLPTAPGPHRITAVDASGAEIFAFSFEANRVADLTGDREGFAFVVPYSALRGRALGTLRLTSRGRTATSLASGDVTADPGVVMTRSDPRHVRLRWDAQRFPVVMVRDAEGRVLSFARGGDATIRTDRSELDLRFSNRVRSSRRLQRIQ